mmetsp:Transcript_29966/g.84540  ORF Transcript_29966/g.84540 Transcript_29966/m.84540 type:complete len:237 (+) Transcript_29966:414-1124(+)
MLSAIPSADISPATRSLRYPDLSSAGGILRGMDYFGTCVFAASGALTAMTSGMDVVGGGIVGIITAVGGGTVRDLVVGSGPVFWLVETEYLVMAAATAVLTYLAAPTAREMWPEGHPVAGAFEGFMKWGDAIGVGAFAAIGSHCGLRRRLPVLTCVLFGLMTATFGGMTRDVLCHRPVRILNTNKELYATVALSSATAYTAATLTGLSPAVRVAMAVGTSLAGRHIATSTPIDGIP